MTQHDVQDVLDALRRNQKVLSELGISRLAVFGSVARGEADPGSDVDLLVEFDHAVGLLQFVHVKHRLEALLGRSVDLVTPDALHPALRSAILDEAVDAA